MAITGKYRGEIRVERGSKVAYTAALPCVSAGTNLRGEKEQQMAYSSTGKDLCRQTLRTSALLWT